MGRRASLLCSRPLSTLQVGSARDAVRPCDCQTHPCAARSCVAGVDVEMPDAGMHAEWLGVEYLPSSAAAASAGSGGAAPAATAAWVPALVVPVAKLGPCCSRLDVAPAAPVASLRISFKGFGKLNKVRGARARFPSSDSDLPSHALIHALNRRTSITAWPRAPSASRRAGLPPASPRRSSTGRRGPCCGRWSDGLNSRRLLPLPPLLLLLRPLKPHPPCQRRPLRARALPTRRRQPSSCSRCGMPAWHFSMSSL